MTQGEVDFLEHTSGLRPLGEYPDHCRQCALVANCDHEDVYEMRVWGGGLLDTVCSRCGTSVSR